MRADGCAPPHLECKFLDIVGEPATRRRVGLAILAAVAPLDRTVRVQQACVKRSQGIGVEGKEFRRNLLLALGVTVGKERSEFLSDRHGKRVSSGPPFAQLKTGGACGFEEELDLPQFAQTENNVVRSREMAISDEEPNQAKERAGRKANPIPMPEEASV